MAAELCHTKIMRKKNSLTKPQPIGEILSAALKRNGMGGGGGGGGGALPMQEQAVIKLWPKAVGAQIAAQTQPDRLRAGTLFVRTSSSVWVQQLHFMKEEIRQKINELAGENGRQGHPLHHRISAVAESTQKRDPSAEKNHPERQRQTNDQKEHGCHRGPGTCGNSRTGHGKRNQFAPSPTGQANSLNICFMAGVYFPGLS